MIAHYPAPWQLEGEGYIFLYRFPHRYRGASHFTAPGLDNQEFTGLGTMMLVDYHSSTAGPYQELLFAPGRFDFRGQKRHSITTIYVSTMESVVNGRENWGIPKELADFSFEKLGRGRKRVTVSKEGTVIFSAIVREYGPSFPVTTRLMPLPLVQLLNGRVFYTRFNGRGKGTMARLSDVTVNPAYFPAIADARPLAGVGVRQFTIEFPEARVEALGERV